MKCGLLGRRLGHSYSPAIHAAFADYEYDLFEKEPEKVKSFLLTGDFTGLNVTMPYKKTVIPYLDELSETAKKLGAVNTIVRRADGSLFGHNSDFFGFASMIRTSKLSVSSKKCLVLGSGGASATAVSVLQEMGATVIVISRKGENNYQNLHLHSDAKIIVNTTPVGMYPNCGVSPIDLSLFPQLEGVLDVIYNPARTQLLLDAEARGLVTMNGLWMLVAQAKESAEYFTGTAIADETLKTVYDHIRSRMENIILIGMPGCGKSTIATLLARHLGRTLIDSDDEVVKIAGRSIPEVFSEYGENAFRQLETEVLQQYGKASGLVIATGGGCVTKEENYPFLHQNGKIIYLQRDISKLPTVGRPLSVDLNAMYAQRFPLYQHFADFTVDNNGACRDTIAQILSLLEENP